MPLLRCDTCSTYAEKPDDVVSWKCGSCTIRGAAKAQHDEEQRLAAYTPERSKAARKAKGWTQKTLVAYLGKGVNIGHVANHERDATPCHPVVADWIAKMESGK